MDGQEGTTTEDNNAAATTAIEISDDLFEKELIKRLGAGSKDLIKKSEQVKVVTDEEKQALEEKRQSDILKFGLEHGHISAKQQEEYIAAVKGDKVELARKKFVALHPELGDKAGAAFNKMFRVEEEDELEDDDEVMKPNEDKKIARSLAEKIAEDEINSRFAPVISLSKKYEEFLTREEIKTANKELITRSISEIPKKMDIDIDGENYSIVISDEDIAAAQEMVVKDALEKKGLTADEIKGNSALFLQAKNLKRIIKEIRDTAVAAALEKAERGKSGIVPERKNIPTGSDDKIKFLQSKGIAVN